LCEAEGAVADVSGRITAIGAAAYRAGTVAGTGSEGAVDAGVWEGRAVGEEALVLGLYCNAEKPE